MGPVFNKIFVTHFKTTVIVFVCASISLCLLATMDYGPDSPAKYEYFNSERKIEFEEQVNPGNEKVIVTWWLWIDGSIAGHGDSKELKMEDVRDYEEQMKDWANNKIHEILESKAKN